MQMVCVTKFDIIHGINSFVQILVFINFLQYFLTFFSLFFKSVFIVEQNLR